MGALVAFLFKRSRGIVISAIVASIISGAASSSLMAFVHRALEKKDSSGSWLMLGFVALCLIFPLSRIVSEVLLVYLSQKVIFDLRVQFIRQILSAPLRKLEEMGPHRILAALTDDVSVLAAGLTNVPVLCLQGAILLSCMAYLAWLSIPLFLITAVVLPLGILGVNGFLSIGMRHFARARKVQDTLYKHMRAVTEGIKTFKLHRARRDAFLAQLFQPTSASYQRENIRGNAIVIAGGSFGTLMFFITLGLFLFVAPRIMQVSTEVLTGYVLIFGFIMVPVSVITSLISSLGRANVALRNIRSLGLELVAETSSNLVAVNATKRTCQKLEMNGITHAYTSESDNSGFVLGPVDLSFRPGELVFITGGNGSGKTTLAKIITGLYTPESGTLLLDGQIINDNSREGYREHFTAVFSDFFLFENLLGLDKHQLDDRARDYLANLHLNHKVQVKDGALSTIELSNGQRKRLALLTAYLEDRPIYLFDEWAADQDPVFKSFFYNEILPELKARGKMVFVITHDDQYYHVADHMIKLDYGKVSFDSRKTEAATAGETLAEKAAATTS